MTEYAASLLPRLAQALLAAVFIAPIPHAAGAPASATAQPAAQSIHVIVPFINGGIADSVAQIVVNKLNETARRQFEIANRPGDDGRFGAEVAAKARPDGYTLLFAPIANYAAAMALHTTLHFDLLADFAPVTLVANAPHVLVSHPSLPLKTVKQIIALAKSRPGQIRWASHGKISLSQLEKEMFGNLTDTRTESVPFRNSSDALPELLTGNVDLLFDSIAAALPHIKSGRLHGIAVAGAKRSPALPRLPTVAEAGVKGFEADYWYGMLAPDGVDRSVISRLNGDFAKAVNAGDVRDRLLFYGIETRSSSPGEVAKIMREEIAKWAKVVKYAGIKPE